MNKAEPKKATPKKATVKESKNPDKKGDNVSAGDTPTKPLREEKPAQPKKKGKDTHTAVLDLRVKLSDKELQSYGAELAELEGQVDLLDAELREARREHKSKVGDIKDRILSLSTKIRERSELSPVECQVTFDHPREGYKRTVRLDTMETVGKDQRMTAAELQRSLFNEGGQS